jgi:DNA ligase-1
VAESGKPTSDKPATFSSQSLKAKQKESVDAVSMVLEDMDVATSAGEGEEEVENDDSDMEVDDGIVSAR